MSHLLASSLIFLWLSEPPRRELVKGGGSKSERRKKREVKKVGDTHLYMWM